MYNSQDMEASIDERMDKEEVVCVCVCVCVYVCVWWNIESESESVSCSIVFNSLQLHGL